MRNLFEPLLAEMGTVENPQGALPRFVQKSKHETLGAKLFLGFDFCNLLAGYFVGLSDD